MFKCFKIFFFLLLTLSCDNYSNKKTVDFIAITGGKEILDNMEIKLTQHIVKNTTIINDTILVFKNNIKLSSVNTNALRYTYHLSYL